MEPTWAVLHLITQIHPEGLYCKNLKRLKVTEVCKGFYQIYQQVKGVTI